MKVLERLKIELNNKDYFTDDTYKMYLSENELKFDDEYKKETMQRNLLLAIVDILESVANDVDLMRKVSDETIGLSTGEAYKILKQRISDIKQRIASLPLTEESYSNVSMLFSKGRR